MTIKYSTMLNPRLEEVSNTGDANLCNSGFSSRVRKPSQRNSARLLTLVGPHPFPAVLSGVIIFR